MHIGLSMMYATQNIVDTLRDARAVKGLSQRALGERAGVPQSHISRIESGGADIRLSSLTELARALDLELRLVPRKAVPAVDGIVRGAVPTVAARPAIRELGRLLDAVRNLGIAYPGLGELKELKTLQDSFHTLRNLRNAGEALEALRDTGKAIRRVERACRNHVGTGLPGTLRHSAGIPEEQLQALRGAARAAENLCSRLVHADTGPPSPRPAYRLDDGRNGDG